MILAINSHPGQYFHHPYDPDHYYVGCSSLETLSWLSNRVQADFIVGRKESGGGTSILPKYRKGAKIDNYPCSDDQANPYFPVKIAGMPNEWKFQPTLEVEFVYTGDIN